MNKKNLSVIILISGILVSAAIIGIAGAQTTAAQTQPQLQPQEQKMPGDIQYPIKELGNCKSKQDCRVFCDNSKNADACLAFAKQHNLMSSEELAAANKFKDNGMVGPGGCKGQAACDQYCGNSDHMEECIAFAQKNGMMSAQQLQESQKVLAAIKNGLKPPACAGPKECDAYCGSSEHMTECMTFSLAAGLVPDGEKAQVQKTLDAIKQGAKPPACHGPQECDKYCGDPAHMEECMAFSLAAGMVPDNQKAQAQKTLDAIKQGIKPPACQPNPPNQSGQPGQPGGAGGPNEGQGFNPGSGQNGSGPGNGQGNQPGQSGQTQPSQANQSSQFGQGLVACDQYCAEPSHVDECVKFSVAIGNMTEQQAQTAIKTGNKGPGGCIGRDACDTFCNNSDNQEICFNFAKDNGMISSDQLQKMQEGQQKMKDSFSQISQEVLDCITTSLGADVVEKMKSGSMIPQKAGDSIGQCFQKYAPQGKMPNQNQPGQPGQGGQNNMPGDLRECLKSQIGEDGLAKVQSGPLNDPVLMEKAQTCFDKYGKQNQQGQPNQQNQNQQGQPGQPGDVNGQPNQQIQPWADMCSNNTALACADEAGKFVESAKVGPDGKPVCPAGSTAKCGNYEQENYQGQNQQGQPGKNFEPGPGAMNPGGEQMPQQAGPGGCKGPEECNTYCESHQDECKNFRPQQNLGQPGQPGQPNQPGQSGQPGQNQPVNQNQNGKMQPGQFNQPGQPGQPNQPMNPGQNGQPGQFIQGQPGQPGQPGPGQPDGQPGQFNQPGQMQPQQQPQPQFQPQPQEQQQNLPPPPSSFLQGAQEFLANISDAFRLDVFK